MKGPGGSKPPGLFVSGLHLPVVMPSKPSAFEEMHIFVQRYTHFANLWTAYNDLLQGRYVPSSGTHSLEGEFPTMHDTMLSVLYAWFYSLVDDHKDGVNAFRVWRRRFPNEEDAIAAVESQVAPIKPALKTFRHLVWVFMAANHGRTKGPDSSYSASTVPRSSWGYDQLPKALNGSA